MKRLTQRLLKEVMKAQEKCPSFTIVITGKTVSIENNDVPFETGKSFSLRTYARKDSFADDMDLFNRIAIATRIWGLEKTLKHYVKRKKLTKSGYMDFGKEVIVYNINRGD